MASVRDSGGNTREPFAIFDRASSSWKTVQHCFFEESTSYSGTWPRSGTLQNGRCFPRAPSVLHTHGKGCSLWPTPTRSMASRGWGLSRTGRQRYNAETEARVRAFVEAHGWKLSPLMLEALMGFPIRWTELPPSETPSSPSSPK